MWASIYGDDDDLFLFGEGIIKWFHVFKNNIFLVHYMSIFLPSDYYLHEMVLESVPGRY